MAQVPRPPGGHLEYTEDPQQCAIRETLRKWVSSSVALIFSESPTTSQRGWQTLYYHLDETQGSAANQQSLSRRGVGYRPVEIGILPSPLFLPLENFIDQKSPPADAILKVRSIDQPLSGTHPAFCDKIQHPFYQSSRGR